MAMWYAGWVSARRIGEVISIAQRNQVVMSYGIIEVKSIVSVHASWPLSSYVSRGSQGSVNTISCSMSGDIAAA